MNSTLFPKLLYRKKERFLKKNISNPKVKGAK